jgi:hypothetical protein
VAVTVDNKGDIVTSQPAESGDVNFFVDPQQNAAKWSQNKKSWRDLKELELNPNAQEFVPDGGPPCGPMKDIEHPRVSSLVKESYRNGPKIAGSIEGVKVEFLADSGAEGTIISTRCLATMPIAMRTQFIDNFSSIFMADGTRVQTQGPVLCKIRIGSREIVEAVFAAEIEDFALLGWAAQLAFGVTYTISGIDVVTSQNNEIPQNSLIRRVHIAEDIDVPARSEIMTRGYVEGSATTATCIIGPIDIIQDGGIVIARALVDASHGDCPIRAMNPSEQVVHLKKNDVVALIEEVVELSLDKESMSTPTSVTTDVPEHLRALYIQSIGEGELNGVVAENLKQLLLKHADVFAKNDDDLGRTDVIKHDIDTGGAVPIRQPPRRLPLVHQTECAKEIEKMLKKGVIEPGSSPWASPVVLVKKRTDPYDSVWIIGN